MHQRLGDKTMGHKICITIGFYSTLIVVLSACGTVVPALNEAWEPAAVSDQLVYRIKKSIYCELTTAVRELDPELTFRSGRIIYKLPANWGAQMTINLQVDETGSVNPSVSPNDYYKYGAAPFVGKVPQSLTIPLAAQLSSQATRIDIYYSYYSLNQLRKRPSELDTSCSEYNETTGNFEDLNRAGSSLLISGKLGIRDWLKGALDAQSKIPSTELVPKSISTKLDVLSYSVKFTTITSGSINPSVKLVSLSTGGALPLLSANRTRAHTLTLTLGPGEQVGSQINIGPSRSAANVHFNQDLQQTITNGFRSALTAP
ncbi:hypothetical protein [Methylobacterium sp. WL19]|uniref:hypothetical protein n=1 Tax=Methylobacterium sp. WL19 TaxID=2603896 RepID=UPI0011CB5D96|nr:hypothetical protein [Methylobacterium sp. WL19]TXN33063.1 hypothetical protein FV220_03825 [Methylobacterium sp. WL19]